MKGYFVGGGYMGYDPESKDYILFASEADYEEYYMEVQNL